MDSMLVMEICQGVRPAGSVRGSLTSLTVTGDLRGRTEGPPFPGLERSWPLALLTDGGGVHGSSATSEASAVSLTL
jgi:hypothetical protein